MLSLPNPYVILAVVLAILAAGAGGLTAGVKYEKGQEARTEVLIAKVADTAQTAAAVEIGKIQIRNTTIQQKTETITRELPVYRDCHNSADVLSLLNSALTNSDPAQPVDSSKLPGADAPK